MIVKEKHNTKSYQNIPINKKIFNKYKSVREIFDSEKIVYKNKIKLNKKIIELKKYNLTKLSLKDLKKLANFIFNKYNISNEFINNDSIIIVSKSGINESVEKIYFNNRQRKLLKEHLQIFSVLGNIIENATLVNQIKEVKNRNDIYYWNYYIDGLIINNKEYKMEFDVRSMQDGQNQYRIQRIEKTKKQINYDSDI